MVLTASCGAATWERPGASRVGILLEDAPLELLQRGRGLEAERLDERGAPRPEPLQGVRLPPGAIQGDHQLAAQSLVERIVEHELLELGHELRAAAELELGPEAPLRDREAQIAQALDHGTGERLEREVGERRAPPLRERLPVERGRPPRRRPTPAPTRRRPRGARRCRRSSASGATRTR